MYIYLFFLILGALDDVTCLRQHPRVSRFMVNPFNLGDNDHGRCLMCEQNTTLSQHIWDQTYDLRQKALTSKIIDGVKSGLLNPVDFGVYTLQDAVWCEKVGDAMLLMAQKLRFSDDIHFYSFLLQKANDYHRYARESFEEWRITNSSAIKQTAANQAYHEYELHVEQTMNVGSFIACMIPCEKLWPWIGEQLLSDNETQSFGVYNDWVHNNLDPTYTEYDELDQLLDMLHAKGEVDEQEALNAFTNCMTGEVDFFNES